MNLINPFTLSNKKGYFPDVSIYDNVAMFCLVKIVKNFIANHDPENKYDVVPSNMNEYYGVVVFDKDLSPEKESIFLERMKRYDQDMETDLISIPLYDPRLDTPERRMRITSFLDYIESSMGIRNIGGILEFEMDRRISRYTEMFEFMETRAYKEISTIITEDILFMPSLDLCKVWKMDIIDYKECIAKPNRKWFCYLDRDSDNSSMLYKMLSGLPVNMGKVSNRILTTESLVSEGIPHFYYGKEIYTIINSFREMEIVYRSLSRESAGYNKINKVSSKRKKLIMSNYPMVRESKSMDSGNRSVDYGSKDLVSPMYESLSYNGTLFLDYSENLKYNCI